MDSSLALSGRTWAIVASGSPAGERAAAVWDRLEHLDRAGHDPGATAALRFVLVHHQPGRSGRCRACRRRGRLVRRRRSWPCVVWSQVYAELFGPAA